MSKLDYSKSLAFLRDSFVPFSNANLSIASSPVLYGLSVYTVLSLNWDEKNKKLYAFRLKDHFNRLVFSSKIMDFDSFPMNWNYERFEKMIRDLVKKNNVRENALIRVSVFVDAIVAGTKVHGLPNSLSAYVYPKGQILPNTGINVCISSWRRNSDNSIPSRAKINGGYANVCLMKNEALLNGYDDAIALDQNGYITEGTVANIFFVYKDKLITPSTNFDILEGITRDSIIKISKGLNIDVEERPISRSEVYTFDEAFVCGSSAGIVPILSIDKREIADGEIGEVTEQLIDVYKNLQKSEKSKFNTLLT